MAVARFTGAWSDTTEQTVLAAKCKVTSIIVNAHQSQSAAAYIQLFDATNPTPGTTAPEVVCKVDQQSVSGKKRFKFVFPGGITFATACTIFCSTTPTGGTAPLTTVLPESIDVFYVIGF